MRRRSSEGALDTAWLRPVCLAVLLLLLHPVRHVGAELIDRIVASVNHDAITLSELNQTVGINQALGGGTGPSVREETLQGIINRHLLLQEAYRLKFVDVSNQDISGEMDTLRNRLGSEHALDDLLDKLDMTKGELSRMLAERLMVERFVDKKVSLFVRVSRDEAEEYFNRNQDRFPGKKFSDMQKEITAGLQARKVDEQLNRYVAELRSKADIRFNP
jgi:hypothetical protein